MRPDGSVQSDGPAILAGTDEPSLQVPEGFDIFSARYSRDGDDLVIAAEGNPPLTVLDYFTADSPPALEMPNGTMLTGDVVELLAGPRAPGQYAQADAPEGAESIGRVETLSGTSTATRVSGETVELAQGDPVFQGDVIETAGDSTLGLRLEDGTLASMSSHSRLVLNEFVFETGGSDNWMLVNLVEGAFAFLTGAIAPSGGMEITTPVAVMAIRGTMPVAFVAGDGGATEFFAASDKDYELLHLTTREILGIVSSAAGFSLSSPDAPLETIVLDPETQSEIEGLLQTLNDAAAELGLLGIQDDSGFHTYSAFGSIDGNLAALIEFLLLLDNALTEEAVLEVKDPDQFLMAEAELIANPDLALTDELNSVIIDVLDNDFHPDGDDLTVVFAEVPNGQGSVTIVDGQYLVYDPGTDFDYLALGETTEVVITYVVSDSTGAIASTTVTVTLTGINQAPVIAPVGETSLDEQTDTQPLDATIAVTFTDVDLNNVGHQVAIVGVAVNGEAGGLTLDNAALMALVSPGTVIKNAGESTGSVDFFFTAAYTVFDYLAEGEVVTLTYTFEIDDGDGGTTLQTFDVTITGTNDAPVIDVPLSDVAATVVEDGFDANGNPIGNPNASGQIQASDVDNGERTFSVAQPDGKFGVFAINAAGAWTYTLDDAAADRLALGQSRTEVFKVIVTDGFGATDEVLVTITVQGSNDAPRVSNVALSATEDGAAVLGSFSGRDRDSDDNAASLIYNVTQPGEGTVINHGDGTFSFDPGDDFQDLGEGVTRQVTFTYTATDRHGLESAPATVTVTVTGTNDVPIISGVSSGAVTEDAHPATLTTSGVLTIVDPDAGESSFVPQAGTAGSNGFGTFTLLADGTWSYSADNTQAEIQQLGAGESLTDSFTAWSFDETASETVTVTIHGTNDAPVIVPEATTDTGALTELENQTGSNFLHEVDGTIAFDDIDLNDTHGAGVKADGTDYLGAFTLGVIDPDSKTVSWSFTVVDADIDHLPEGEIRTQTYTVTIDDGQGGTVEHVVTITITGTNDAPVIIVGVGDSASADLVEDDDALDADGTLTVSDVSVQDVVTARVVEVEASGDHHTEVANEALLGFLTVSSPVIGSEAAEGTLTWEFHSTGEAFDFLAEGEELVLVYTIEVDDGIATTSFDVTITIAGTNDAPVITVGSGDSAEAGLTESDVGLQAQGTLSASDLDISDQVTATVEGVAATGDFSGEIPVATLAGFLTVSNPVIADGNTAGKLNWFFNSDNEAFDFLAKDERLVLTYTVKIDDGSGGSDTQDVVITITGTNDAPVIDVEGSVVADTVVEAGLDGDQNTVGDQTASGQIVADDVDNGAMLTYSVATAAGIYGAFAIDAATGAWTYTLDEAKAEHLALGESQLEEFTVTVTDEHGATDEIVVTINVIGSNDAPTTDDVSGLSGFAGTAIEITLSGSDVDGTVSYFKITSAPTDGGLFLDAEGLTPVDPDNIAASGNEATIYFIPDSGMSGEVGFEYAAVDNFGAQDQTPASVEITVETTKIYLMIHQDSWQGSADLPTFDGFQVTIGGVTYDLGDLTVVASDYYQQDGEDGFTLGVGTGSGGKERFVIFEIDGVPGGASAEISFDYKVTNTQGDSVHDGIRFYAGDTQDREGMVLIYDGDQDPAFTGNEKNQEFSARLLSFNYALVAGATIAIADVELTAPLDPIVLDLGEPGFDFSGTTTFDLTDDGQQETLAWTGGEDGILVMDLDRSGAIESGNEMFSPFFNGGGFDDALAALASLDANGDGVIDAEDEAFADLLVWVDSNGDGMSQPDELFSLADLGIASLNLNAEGTDYKIDGQTVIADGQFTWDDGTIGNYVAVELDEIFASSEPQGDLFALSDLTMDDVIVDYREGDVIDLARLGFELATGQLNADAAAEYVAYDSAEGVLWIDMDGAGGEAEFQSVAEFVTPPPSVLVRLSDGDTTADIQIA